jgi:hypothetical protein
LHKITLLYLFDKQILQTSTKNFFCKKCPHWELRFLLGGVLAAFEELGKPILWGMGWVNRRLGSFGGHPIQLT